MRSRYLLGLILVLLLILAVWLVPLALAAVGGADAQTGPAQAHGQGTECPFLQTHPWLDPHGSGGSTGGGGASGASTQVIYY